MPSELRRKYWDACCFTSYINEDRDRLPMLDAVLDEAQQSNGSIQIVTSTLSKVEVAFSVTERAKRQISPSEQERIASLWADTSVIYLVEPHELIMDDAADMVRQAMQNDLRLTPRDAIHLATAKRLSIPEFHTYDDKLMNDFYVS